MSNLSITLHVMKHNIQNISSLEMPELQPYRTLRRPLEHIQHGIFVAEGTKVVDRLLHSSIEIHSILVTPEWYESLSSLPEVQATLETIPTVFIAEKHLLEDIVGYNLHQGIMAVARIPKNISLSELMPAIRQPHFLVALDGLVNSENVGVIVRNCAAFGIDGIIVGETSSSPFLRRAVRNSMGTVFHIPIIHVEHLGESLTYLHQTFKTEIIAAHPHDKATIHNTDFTGNICIVLGHEGLGVSQPILDICTQRIAIPMENNTDSLNVASASAVFLYEARKQRIDSMERKA